MKLRAVTIVVTALVMAAPAFAQGPPDMSGPIVVRYELDGETEGLWWGYADAKRGYVAFHGVDIAAACAGSPSGWNVYYVQDVMPPAADGLIMETMKGEDITTSVYPIAILDQSVYPVWCLGVLDLGPIAVGTVDMIVTDNDLLAWQYDHNRVNAYGISAHGILFDPEDDEPMRLNAGFRCVWGGLDNDDFAGAHCKNKIVLN
jgi:hypothetical protein